MFSLEFYTTTSGDSPSKDFIRSMSAKGKAKFLQISGLLEEIGPDVRMPYSRHLEDGIFEIRVIVGNDSSRILYFFHGRPEDYLHERFHEEDTENAKT